MVRQLYPIEYPSSHYRPPQADRNSFWRAAKYPAGTNIIINKKN
jgi:hypothetical protein